MAFGLFTLLLTGLGAAAQIDAGNQQAAYAKRQQKIQRNMNVLKERRAKINSFKEQRRAQAEVTQAGVGSGSNFQGSSGYQGGISSIGSQFANNEAWANQMNTLVEQSGGNRSKVIAAQNRAQLFQAGTNLIGNHFGGYSEMRDITRNLFK